MREISTKNIEVGEHVLIDGVEYVAEEDGVSCKSCDMKGCGFCYLIPCINGLTLKRVEKQPTEKEYKVEKHDKNTPMTNLQLAEWLAKGHGQYRLRNGRLECSFWMVDKCQEDLEVDNILIRPWGTDEWVRPTVGIYERDCR